MGDYNYYLKAADAGEFKIVKAGRLWHLRPRILDNPETYSSAYMVVPGT